MMLYPFSTIIYVEDCVTPPPLHHTNKNTSRNLRNTWLCIFVILVNIVYISIIEIPLFYFYFIWLCRFGVWLIRSQMSVTSQCFYLLHNFVIKMLKQISSHQCQKCITKIDPRRLCSFISNILSNSAAITWKWKSQINMNFLWECPWAHGDCNKVTIWGSPATVRFDNARSKAILTNTGQVVFYLKETAHHTRTDIC